MAVRFRFFSLKYLTESHQEFLARRGAKSAKKSRNPSLIPLCQRGKEGDLRWVSVAVFIVVVVLSQGTLYAQTQKIRIAYSSRSNTITPFYVAASKGFFREEGLEVELIQVSPRLGAMAVMNGDVTFTTSFTSTF